MEILNTLNQVLSMGGNGAMIVIAIVLLKQDRRIFHLELINGIKP